jgi:NADPH:quinone reductase-like Zn-dependent oxidoreductase
MRIPERMAAVRLMAHGGPETLVYAEDVAVPVPGAGEVLIRVAAAGINNTDINTRIGWYAEAASGATADEEASGTARTDGGWTAGFAFPRIQGADCCGVIVALGPGVAPARLGERVIAQSCLLSLKQGAFVPWLGSERDGAFAQFMTAPAADVHRIDSTLSDEQLAAVPCAFATAENLLTRAGVAAGETVLVTGASGNVGIAAVQLARLRGASVIAVAAASKRAAIEALGAARVIDRDASIVDALGPDSVDVAIDVVGGPRWPELPVVLKTGGRYAVSGAIAGPMVPLDLRKLYLKDLSFFGCTAQEAGVFPRLVSYLNAGRLAPLVSRSFPLREIAAAQAAFLSKAHIGKIVLIPPPV